MSLEVESHDEICEHIDGWFIGASKGVWRIFHFDMHNEFPNVVHLEVHLPGHHLVHFNPDEDTAAVMDWASREETKLSTFFKANRDTGKLGDTAHQLTYQEFLQKLVWDRNKKRWAVWKQDRFSIGRMHSASPTSGERFYLQTLLMIVKGSTSFEDLCTIAGIIYSTFCDTCIAYGLLEDDGEWVICLRDSSKMQTGTSLWQLFASLLLFCSPTHPDKLREQFRNFICDDLAHCI